MKHARRNENKSFVVFSRMFDEKAKKPATGESQHKRTSSGIIDSNVIYDFRNSFAEIPVISSE